MRSVCTSHCIQQKISITFIKDLRTRVYSFQNIFLIPFLFLDWTLYRCRGCMKIGILPTIKTSLGKISEEEFKYSIEV